MEKILVKAFGQDVSKLAVQERRLRLSRPLARFAHEIRNPSSAFGSHAQLLEGDLPELEPQGKEKPAERVEMIYRQPDPLEKIVEQFLRLSSAQQIFPPNGGNFQTANAQRVSATFTVRLRGRPKENYDGQVKD
jgi:nitrogen-specific signal transduction histidine kinase